MLFRSIWLLILRDLLGYSIRSRQFVAQADTQNRVGYGARGPAVSVIEWVNPVNSPKQVGTQVDRWLVQVRINIVAHLFHKLRHEIRRRRMVAAVADDHFVGTKDAGQPIKPFDGYAIEPQDIGHAELERRTSGTVNERTDRVHLAQTIARLNERNLVRICRQIRPQRLTLALSFLSQTLPPLRRRRRGRL